jgi:hypothetical protein
MKKMHVPRQVLFSALTVSSGHGPHSFPSQNTQWSQEEQAKGGADGNGVVKEG